MRGHFVFVGVSALAFILWTLSICTTEVSARHRKYYGTCEEAGCKAKNLSCCYYDDDDIDNDDFDSDNDRKRRRITDAYSGFYCCDRLPLILGLSLGLRIPGIGFIILGIIYSVYVKYLKKKKEATTTTAAPVSTTTSYQALSRTDLQTEPVGTSSTITNSSCASPAVTNSFDLYSTASTFHSAPTEQQTLRDTKFATNGPTGSTKLIAKGPPSYSSLYHS